MRDSVERAKEVRHYRDLQAIRAMLLVANRTLKERNRDKSQDFDDALMGLVNTYQRMRRSQRNETVEAMRKAKYATDAKETIISDFRQLCRKYEFSETVFVGDKRYKTPAAMSANRKRSAGVTFHVGYLWHRRVWETVQKEGRMVSQNIIILAATEYRTNVPHIRLYEAIAYNVVSKRTASGWIGQSKLGKQRCVFVPDKTLAIHEAIKQAANAVSEQIKGETP